MTRHQDSKSISHPWGEDLLMQNEKASRALAQAMSDASSSLLLSGRDQILTSITCGRLMLADSLNIGSEFKALTQRQSWAKHILEQKACSPRQMDITDHIWSVWYTRFWMNVGLRQGMIKLAVICLPHTHQTTFILTAGDDNLAVSESKTLKPCNMQCELERLEQLVELKLSKPRDTDLVSVSIQTLVKTMIAEAAWRPLRA